MSFSEGQHFQLHTSLHLETDEEAWSHTMLASIFTMILFVTGFPQERCTSSLFEKKPALVIFCKYIQSSNSKFWVISIISKLKKLGHDKFLKQHKCCRWDIFTALEVVWQPPPPPRKKCQKRPLTLKRLGGPKRPPSTFAWLLCNAQSSRCDTVWLFLSSFPHILTPNLWRPGVRFWSYITFCTCTSDRKWLQNVILCTKSMQIEFFHIVHINMLIFTLNGWNEFVFNSIIVLQKVSATNFTEKNNKNKRSKKQRNT